MCPASQVPALKASGPLQCQKVPSAINPTACDWDRRHQITAGLVFYALRRFWDWTSGNCFQQGQTIVQPGSIESEAGIFATAFDQTGMASPDA